MTKPEKECSNRENFIGFLIIIVIMIEILGNYCIIRFKWMDETQFIVELRLQRRDHSVHHGRNHSENRRNQSVV